MSPEEIKTELFKIRKETSMAEIGRNLNPPVSRTMVFYVIERKFVSERVARAVAETIKIDFKTVFPEYYLKNTRRSVHR